MEGKLIYHDGMRKWFELKLDQPHCGQTSTQLLPGKHAYASRYPAPLEALRGCRVRSTGVIDFSPTGYYSLETYQAVNQIEPVGVCERQPPFPDYSKSKPDKLIRQYRVDMQVNCDENHPIVFRVSSGGKDLQPWQAYASYLADRWVCSIWVLC